VSPTGVQLAAPFRVYSVPAPVEWLPLYRVFFWPIPSPSHIRTTWTRPWWPPQSMCHMTGPARNCLGRPRMFLVPPGVGLVWQRPRGTNLRWQYWRDSPAVMCDTGRTTLSVTAISCPPKSDRRLLYSGPRRFGKTEVETPHAVVNPHYEPLILRLSPTVQLLALPLSRPGRPTCPPRHGAHVRVTPVEVGPNRPRQS
jgi:hypothetical protein